MSVVISLVSGGFDSLYATYDRLKNSSDYVRMIYFDVSSILSTKTVGAIGTQAGIVAQTRIVQAAAKWLSENVRPVSVEIVPMTFCRWNGWWSTEAIFWAKDQCNEGLADEIISGWGGENINLHRAVVLRKLQRKIFEKYSLRGKLSFPLENLSRLDTLDKMPAPLARMTLACGSPVILDNDIYFCGKCNKCVREKYLEELLKKNLPYHQLCAMYQAKIVATTVSPLTYQEMYPDFELWSLLES